MELALSLGDTPKPFSLLNKSPQIVSSSSSDFALGFRVGLPNDSGSGSGSEEGREIHENGEEEEEEVDPPIQLNLLPSGPVPRSHSSFHLRFPWLSDHLTPELGCSSDGAERVVDVNRVPEAAAEETEDRAALSSPNSAVSSFQMEFGFRNGGRNYKRDLEVETERASSRVSDDDENGSARKKLRLSKEQSAFLEQSFKEHSTLNPQQKQALAKQLNLRPRQVEVWFQNRRARTKLKQTEVDCEYLRRCCETLTEENRRLQKELQELRALKSSHPFYMQLPATTLTMCPACERVATTSSAAKPAAAATVATATTNVSALKPRVHPFTHSPSHLHQTAS